MKKGLRMLLVMFCPLVGMMAGFAQAEPKSPVSGADEISPVQSLFAQAAGKTVVFSLNGDAEIRRRLERSIAAEMKSQGFDAYEGGAQIPRANHYSPDGLAAFFLKAGFKSIAEVTYTGEIPNSGLPKNLHFNLHTLPKPGEATYSHEATSLDAAVRSVIDSLNRVKLETAPAE